MSAPPIIRRVAHNIRTLREKKHHLSQKALAEAAGISRHTLLRIESGDHPIDLSDLSRIARELDVNLVDLFESGNDESSAEAAEPVPQDEASKIRADAIRVLSTLNHPELLKLALAHLKALAGEPVNLSLDEEPQELSQRNRKLKR